MTALFEPEYQDQEAVTTDEAVAMSAHDKAAKAERALRTRMIVFNSEVTAESLANLGPRGTKTEYKGKPMAKPNAKKAHNQSIVFQAIEALVDFQSAMEQRDYEAAKPFYFLLIRILGY